MSLVYIQHSGCASTEVPAIASAMPDRWAAAVYLMAATGLRLGECLGLTTDKVDWFGGRSSSTGS